MRSSILLSLFMMLTAAAAVAQTAAPPDHGLAETLARHRARTIGNLRYDLTLTVPRAAAAPIDGTLLVRFTLSDLSQPLVLDFDPEDPQVTSITSGGRPTAFTLVNGHIVIPADALRVGANELEIRFRAGDGSLNRNPDFLYTLFVPDRASNAFPSFDQPDLKAEYRLTLEIPAEWQAVSNGAVLEAGATSADRKRIVFAPTRPLSTYLFSFAAGRFEVETAQRDGRTLRMYHRETDTAKVARNRDTIFDLHAAALRWLEDYTGIPLPFDKFDFVLIPSFQYGGMEHPGAVLYNATALLLDEAATQTELLGRASLIAHETAHMWFGDLVTMRWFNDVWMKEVFANFMAAKIVNPAFPDIDHDLRFLLAHHPAAYAVDRTAGTHAIRQQLDNLNEAGSLYGAIIYQKAPIVMRQLETLVGDQPFRDGLREYLRSFSYGNATWQDLVAILDGRSAHDLAAWSRVWVEEPDRPVIGAAVDIAADGRVSDLVLQQTDPAGRGRVWPQRVDVWLAWGDSALALPVISDAAETRVPAAEGLPAPRLLLPDASGLGYAHFLLDDATLAWTADSLAALPTPVTRGSATLALYDALLTKRILPDRLLETLLTAVSVEPEQLLVERYLATMATVFWRFMTPDQRAPAAARLEDVLWHGLGNAQGSSAKAAWFAALRDIALTPATLHRLHDIWAQRDSVIGLPLAERDYTALAQSLAVRDIDGSAQMLEQQLVRIDNPDRRARFAFILPALSSDTAVRHSFFHSLADVRNRSHEPWVLDALAALNHPVRAAHAEKFIRPALELLPEIQRTGDIFFPRRWAGALLSGHATPAAAAEVRAFLDATPDLAPRMRGIVLQAADELFRAADLQ